MIEAARLKNSQICILDGSSMMHIYAGQEDITYVGNDEELFDYFHNTLTPEFVRRNAIKKQILSQQEVKRRNCMNTQKRNTGIYFHTGYGMVY